MWTLRASLLAVITACSYSPGTSSDVPTDGMQPDGPEIDAPVVEPRCFGTFRKVCFRPKSEPFALNGAMNTVLTEMMSQCAALTNESTVNACVITGSSVHIDGTLLGIGGLPLVIVATDGELVVDGAIDVSSLSGDARRGAGANPVGSCAGTVGGGGGGGAGGSFGNKGGDGGDGFGGVGGAAAEPIELPAQLRGGCPGTLGGNATASTGPGSGGGAVWLVSTVGITINGTINASGSGGIGGTGDPDAEHGGAGGGSGGMVVFDAPTIAITSDATVMAQGGGGGGGNIDGLKGGDGGNPDIDHPGDPAFGGFGDFTLGGNGGTDGDGGNGETNSIESGCGGGGGAGFVHAFGTADSNGDVFPPLQTN